MAEEDKDWKPNGRPQSTMARSFSAALHDMFDLDNTLGDLSLSVEQKKQAVTTQNKELEALEARLRKTEQILKEKRRQSGSFGGRSSPIRRTPLKGAFDMENPQSPTAESSSSRPLPRRTTSQLSSSATPQPDTLPEISDEPSSSSAEYVVVDKPEDSIQEVERPKTSTHSGKAPRRHTNSRRPSAPPPPPAKV